jgi:hypothetical protein
LNAALGGLRANSSRRSDAELENPTELDAGGPKSSRRAAAVAVAGRARRQ